MKEAAAVVRYPLLNSFPSGRCQLSQLTARFTYTQQCQNIVESMSCHDKCYQLTSYIDNTNSICKEWSSAPLSATCFQGVELQI